MMQVDRLAYSFVNMSNLGLRIKQARELAKLSQDDLAVAVGMKHLRGKGDMKINSVTYSFIY